VTREWAPYRTVRELIHRHVGKPAVVIGGGPSAPAGLARCPTDAIGISANDHGFRLRACDFITSLDRIERRLRPHGVPIVSRHLFADYRVLVPPQPNSGIVGAWLARLLGCSPIYLVGMDCFSGETYFHDPTAKSSGFSDLPRNHLARWREFLRKFPAAYAAFTSPLTAHCESLDERLPSQDRLLREVSGELVRFHRAATFRAFGIERPFAAGDVIEVEAEEARRLIRERKAGKASLPERRAG
jgi:hypothetical protein